jgi:phage anti-repressor protein
MSDLIKLSLPTTIDFSQLIKNTTFSLDLQSKLVDKLNNDFTEEEQKWYIANLYMYLNYHVTEDYPINLENVFKMIGFANKGNAKRTLENNFELNIDYKIILLPREKKQNAGRSEEDILLNIDTFKSLCMLAKTDQGKQMRKYYTKLENITNQLIKEELEENKKLLEEQEQLLIEQKEINKSDKQEILLRSYHKKYIVYLVHIRDILYKFGHSDDIRDRLASHRREYGKNSRLIYCIESKNNTLLESQIKKYVKAYQKKLIINGEVKTELIEINDINLVKKQLVVLNNKIHEDKELLLCKERILQLENEKKKLINVEDNITLLTLENKKLELQNTNIQLQIKLKELSPEKTEVEVKVENDLDDRIKKQQNYIMEKTIEKERQERQEVEEVNEIYEDIELDIIEVNEVEESTPGIEARELDEVNKKEMDRLAKRRASDILYRQKNAEKIRANRALEENRIKKRAADKLYRENNKEKIKLMQQEYGKKRYGKETVRNYYNNNKEEINRKRREYILRKKNEISGVTVDN